MLLTLEGLNNFTKHYRAVTVRLHGGRTLAFIPEPIKTLEMFNSTRIYMKLSNKQILLAGLMATLGFAAVAQNAAPAA
ncbi:MAG: hypothetical protein Q7K57_17110, partial [Burkholderiaceae bacterium]|nr:hypothetical protein [Burkholderiaceae bacterium]